MKEGTQSAKHSRHLGMWLIVLMLLIFLVLGVCGIGVWLAWREYVEQPVGFYPTGGASGTLNNHTDAVERVGSYKQGKLLISVPMENHPVMVRRQWGTIRVLIGYTFTKDVAMDALIYAYVNTKDSGDKC